MIWKITFASTILVSITFVALWFQRKRSAELRRATCIVGVVACLVSVALSLVPENLVPAVPSPIESRLPVIAAFSSPVREVQSMAMPVESVPLRQVPALPAWRTVYLAGIAAMVAFWFLGWVGCFRLLRCGRGSAEVQGRTPIRTVLVPNLAVPLCVGWPLQMIALPPEAQHWSPETLDPILRHEEAHLARRDHVWMHVTHFLRAIQWFNPLVWLLSRRIRIESERLADDRVLASGVRPSAYAAVLLDFRPRRLRQPALFRIQPLLINGGLTERLESILSSGTKRDPMKHTHKLLLGAVAAATLVVTSAFTFGVKQRNPDPGATASEGRPAQLPYPQFTVSRKVQVLQIAMRAGSRDLVWDISGKPDSTGQAIPHKWLADLNLASPSSGPRYGIAIFRHIIFRVQAQPNDGRPEISFEPPAPIELTLGKGYGEEAGPSQLLKTENGWHYFDAPVAIFTKTAKGEVEAPETYGVGKIPLAITIAITKPLDEGPVGSVPPFSKWTASSYSGTLMGLETGPPDKDNNSKVWSKVSFTRPTMVWYKAHFFTRDGREIPDSLVEGEFFETPVLHHLMRACYYVGVAPEDIGEVRVSTQKTVNVEFAGIPMSPRSDPVNP